MMEVCYLRKRVKELIEAEKRALLSDNRNDPCVANHRGAITAYTNVLHEIDRQSEKKPVKKSRGEPV